MVEDLLQLLPVFDKARSLCSLDDVLYFYRTNDTASTSAISFAAIRHQGRQPRTAQIREEMGRIMLSKRVCRRGPAVH